MTMMKSRTVSVSIAASPIDVYVFVSNPKNLPKWAPAFCQSVSQVNGKWVVQTPNGPMEVEFVEKNAFGVLDHTVTLQSGLKILNPMRVIANGSGSELIFTLFQTPEVSDKKFAEDAVLVEKDLNTLKKVIEA